jgi:hypothetical protein
VNNSEATAVAIDVEKLVRLDLGCGQSPQEGYTGVDLWAPDADIKMDLLKFPWPWADDSVDEIFSSHFIEHIPMEYVDSRHLVYEKKELRGYGTYQFIPHRSPHEGKDLFFAFFDEVWRVLKKGDDPNKPAGIAHIHCPCARSNRGFQDPTHRRYIVEETFLYLWRDWRVQCKLDHYRVDCNFVHEYRQIIKKGLLRLSPEARQERCQSQWNAVADLDVTLIALR